MGIQVCCYICFPLHLTGLKEWIIAYGYTSMLLYLLSVTPDRFDGMDYKLRGCYTQSRAPGCTTSCAPVMAEGDLWLMTPL